MSESQKQPLRVTLVETEHGLSTFTDNREVPADKIVAELVVEQGFRLHVGATGSTVEVLR